MRNVKILWTIIGLLLICVIYSVLSSFIFSQADSSTDKVFNNKEAIDKKEDPNRVVATIGEYNITYKQLHNNLEQKYGKELLNQILDNEAVAQKGTALGLRIEENEIQDELKRMQLGYDNEELFYSSMKEQLNMSKEDIKKDIFYKLLLEKIATYQIVITDKMVDEYISSNPDEFKSQTQLHLLQIMVGTQKEAEDVVKELLGGADFAALAKERSKDEMTSADGGDLGWVESNDPFVQEEIMQSAIQLKPGEISIPIKLPQGYAVIKVTEIKEPDPQNEANVKETVRKELALNKAVPLKELLTSIRNELHTVIVDPKLK